MNWHRNARAYGPSLLELAYANHWRLIYTLEIDFVVTERFWIAV